MTFARRVFYGASLYGAISVVPLFFQEGVHAAPASTLSHPQFYYGFVGVTAAWQAAFLLIGRDPIRYRPLMAVAIMEKLSATFFLALVLVGRAPSYPWVLAGGIDLTLAALFGLSWWRLREDRA